ncbi:MULTISPECIES: hypothetical protein [Dolichospermum]|uniref:Uncharacterized protein n=1 Tax=Dolichospermum flos-aquae CCAP 1403/13F TaxID=315271 RepID=A0A6H2BVX0_DOLFA|nr:MULTISPECIES: hypothetical protein [Dolichospermum]QJB42924.1 hypothetical protein HGD76_00350 [Dolichospermum flos-aquae CCAP 1403/13F]
MIIAQTLVNTGRLISIHKIAYFNGNITNNSAANTNRSHRFDLGGEGEMSLISV